MLIPHEDKVYVVTPFNIGHKGWRIWIPHEDKVDVIIPILVLFRGGGEFWSLMKIELMLFPQSTYCSVMSQSWVWANVKVADNMLTKHWIKEKHQSCGYTWLNLETRKDGNIKQSDGYIIKSWGHKQVEADQSRISMRWSKWFKEAKTADHSFSSISFQRLTKIARHFKLLSVPHSECSASIASKLWKPQELPMPSLKRWINSSFSACHGLSCLLSQKKMTLSVWTWVNYNLA